MRAVLVMMFATTPAIAAPCVDVGDGAAIDIGGAATADDYALTVSAQSASATSWGEAGNEALVLEVSGARRGLIGHLILHQGRTKFDYAMHLGALDANERVSLRVSPLSAVKAVKKATACDVKLVAAATLGAAAEGLRHAPSFRWPAQKAFNDIPMIEGWSQARREYVTVMTNEDGGTAKICGGGATGMQSEIARWGRSTDIENHYAYGGSAPVWERCTGSVATTKIPLRMEGDHPIIYWGDGHNRVFESRGGYGKTCGTRAPEMPDGDFAGWNTQNPSDALADDAGKVIIVRPLPFELDPLGYAQFGGRREALTDHYGPWLYRVASLELEKEGKIDNAKTFGMSRYLYVDVRVADVGGTGDSYCTLRVYGGFKLRAVTTKGVEISSPQITGGYAGGGKHAWKRVAIALPDGVTAADIDHFVFDAYDGDGIYLTGIGDAFIAIGDGTTNGAKLDYVRRGTKAITDYVDDNSSGCKSGVNDHGPDAGPYTCVGGKVDIAK